MFGSNAVWQIPSKNGATFCNEDRAFFLQKNRAWSLCFYWYFQKRGKKNRFFPIIYFIIVIRHIRPNSRATCTRISGSKCFVHPLEHSHKECSLKWRSLTLLNACEIGWFIVPYLFCNSVFSLSCFGSNHVKHMAKASRFSILKFEFFWPYKSDFMQLPQRYLVATHCQATLDPGFQNLSFGAAPWLHQSFLLVLQLSRTSGCRFSSSRLKTVHLCTKRAHFQSRISSQRRGNLKSITTCVGVRPWKVPIPKPTCKFTNSSTTTPIVPQ